MGHGAGVKVDQLQHRVTEEKNKEANADSTKLSSSVSVIIPAVLSVVCRVNIQLLSNRK